MKKRVLSIALVVAMIAIIAAGSFAYFTDKDAKDNVFTAGGVDIQLIEQQRSENGTELVDFEQNKVLMPIVGSAQGPKDSFGLPLAKNYVDKVVTVKNTGKSDAYVRAYFAIPSELDDGEETFNAGANILHFNFGNKMVDGKAVSTFGAEWVWLNADNSYKYLETTIDGVAYNVYYADYYQPLAAGETTKRLVDGVYLDNNVDMKGGKYVDNRFPDAVLTILEGEVKCPVATVAVQADGFASVDEAVNAAFGANFDPFAK